MAIYCVFCRNNAKKMAIYCVFCRNLRVFRCKFYSPKILLVKKKWQISGMWQCWHARDDPNREEDSDWQWQCTSWRFSFNPWVTGFDWYIVGSNITSTSGNMEDPLERCSQLDACYQLEGKTNIYLQRYKYVGRLCIIQCAWNFCIFGAVFCSLAAPST